MALSKKIASENGVTLTYHRIVAINIYTNVQNSIEVRSYTSEEKRQEEAKAIATDGNMNVYAESAYYAVPYDQSMTIESAYEYLKTLPEFEDVEDI